MMYCETCGELFEEREAENNIEVLFHDELDEGPRSEYLSYKTCPHCGSEEIFYADQCPLCGRWHKPVKGHSFCKDCVKEADKLIDVLAKRGNRERALDLITEVFA
jgi:hypothetical protein